MFIIATINNPQGMKMIAVSTSYNPNRHQFMPEYVDHWNKAKPSERRKLLSDAGYPTGNSYTHRAWAFVPEKIREDVIAVIKRQRAAIAAKPTPSPKPAKEFWYDKL